MKAKPATTTTAKTKTVAEMSDPELRELVDEIFYHGAMAELEREEQATLSFLTKVENQKQQPPR